MTGFESPGRPTPPTLTRHEWRGASFIPPPPFFEGSRAEFDAILDNCWYGRLVLLFRIRVKTDEKDRNGRSVLKDCDCAMIDCLYDYAPGR